MEEETTLSKKNTDIEKILEERKELAKRWGFSKEPIKTKQKKKSEPKVVSFKEELDKFLTLKNEAEESTIPVEEYEDPPGIDLFDINKYQQMWNSRSAYKKTILRKGHRNLKIKNILKYDNYTQEEKNSLSLNLFYLMSISKEYAEDCENILNNWILEWHPNFENICLIFDNLGFNISNILKECYICESYVNKCEETRLIYKDYNSNDEIKVEFDQLSYVLKYLKSVIQNLEQIEVESLLVLACIISVDSHCIQYSELFNEIVNKCLDHIDDFKYETIIYKLYTSITNSHVQCFLVNKILHLYNTKYSLFVSKLSYLYLYNIIYNDEVDVNKRVKNEIIEISDEDIENNKINTKAVDVNSNNTNINTRQSKRNAEKNKKTNEIIENNSKLEIKQKPKVIEKESKKVVKNSKKIKTKNTSDNLKQLSLYSFFKEKSPDLSVKFKENEMQTDENKATSTKHATLKSNAENCDYDVQNENLNENIIKVKEEFKIKSENKFCLNNEFEKESKEPKHIQIYNKHKNDNVRFECLYNLIYKNIRSCLNNPLKIYRITYLLNNIIENLTIQVNNIETCTQIINILQKVQICYYGLHDIHRHLVCVYLQQYTTKWNTVINLHKYRLESEDEEENIDELIDKDELIEKPDKEEINDDVNME